MQHKKITTLYIILKLPGQCTSYEKDADTCLIPQRNRTGHFGITSARPTLPIPGRVSIIHRVSVLALFLCLFWLLYLLEASLVSPESFAKYKAVVAHPLAKLALLGFIWAFLHHFCAGIRFLLMDIHIGASLAATRKSSAVVFAVSLVVIFGARLW